MATASQRQRIERARVFYSQTFAESDKVVIHDGQYREEVFLSINTSSPFIKALLAQQIGDNSRGKRLLSIGVGSGILEETLIKDYGVDITGVDITEELLKRAQAKSVKTVLANGEDLPFDNASFDIVIICESIGHMDLDKVLAEAARVLRPGGEIHITTYSTHDELHDKIEYEIYSKSAIISAIENAGFGEISDKADILNLRGFIYLKAVKLPQKSSSAGKHAKRYPDAQTRVSLLRSVVRGVWPNDKYVEGMKNINNTQFTVIHGEHYIIAGNFIFTSESEWLRNKEKLRGYKDLVIICSIFDRDLGWYANFANRDHTCLAVLLLQAYPDFIKNKVVLDAGSGSDAVLSVLASRLGAKKVIAVERNKKKIAESLRLLALNETHDVMPVEKDLADYKGIEGILYIDTVVANLNQMDSIYKSGTYYRNMHKYLAGSMNPVNYFLLGLMGHDANVVNLAERDMNQDGWQAIERVSLPGIAFQSAALMLRKTHNATGSGVAQPISGSISISPAVKALFAGTAIDSAA